MIHPPLRPDSSKGHFDLEGVAVFIDPRKKLNFP